MRCKAAQHQLSLQLDGRLRQALVAELEAHLATCESCRQARAQLVSAWALLTDTTVPQAPDDWRSIAARVDEPRSGLKAWLEDLWLANPGRLATAAALSVFLFSGVAAGSWLSRGLRPSLPVEAVAMAEAFGDVPGADLFEGQVRP